MKRIRWSSGYGVVKKQQITSSLDKSKTNHLVNQNFLLIIFAALCLFIIECLIIRGTHKNQSKILSEGNPDLMKPILLKAGIPLALSFAGFIFSVITTRRRSYIRSSSSSQQDQASSSEIDSQEEEDQESFHSLEEQLITDTEIVDSFVSSSIRDRQNFEEEILRLKILVGSIHNRELELERWFVLFCGLKEQEMILMEQRNKLVLELARVEFLGMMVDSMEAESRRLEAVVYEYLRVLEQLRSANLENSLLKMKVNKLLGTTRKHSRVFCQQALMIRAQETKVSRSREELEQKDQVIKDLQDEIMELKRIVDRLQEEKNELVEKLELGENSAASSTSQIQTENSAIDHQDPRLDELEQLRNARVAEAEELIYLRWINACLRHELMKNQEQKRHEQEEDQGLVLNLEVKESRLGIEEEEEKENDFEQHDLEFEEGENRENNHGYDSDNLSMATENGESRTRITGIGHKKPKILQKLKKWVKGNEGCKKPCNEEEEHHNNCFRRRSVSDEATEKLVAARKSCSSA